MIEIEETGGGLRVVDAAKNEMEIEIEGWERGGEELEIAREVDETVCGLADQLKIPGMAVTIESSGRDQWLVAPFDDKLRLSPDEHLVQVEGMINVFVRLNSGLTVLPNSKEGSVTLSLVEQSSVTIGCRSYERFPTEKIRMPPTFEGFAKAITVAGSYHRTSSPDRSYATMRGCPPLFEFDESATVDDTGLHSERPIRFLLPSDLSTLFSVSPLIYYLSGSVEINDKIEPTIIVRSTKYKLASLGSNPEDFAALLKRVFYLDCLVRNVGPYGFDLREMQLLEELSLDADRLYSLSIAERFDEYLTIPFELIADKFPEWPLAVSVEPKMENSTTIPHLLDRLSLIFPAAATKLDGRTLLQRSLGDFHRSTKSNDITRGNDLISLLEPKSNEGKVRGWIAEGTTVDAFNCPPEAFSNREKYFSSDPPHSISIILNDRAMEDEFAEVVNEYQERANIGPIDVTVKTNLTTEELSREFREGKDFLHYIGHCDKDGLRCNDGNLAISTLPESNVQGFFLNACNSYSEGLELIKQGSVAGAVTIADVVDEQAQRVGPIFARLLVQGFNVSHALRTSRSQAIMNRQYIVVGDGTFIPTPVSETYPTVLNIWRLASGGYQIECNSQTEDYHGGVFHPLCSTDPVLAGSQLPNEVTAGELTDFLETIHDPIIFEDRFYWPDELLEELD